MKWVIQNQGLFRWLALLTSLVVWIVYLQTIDRTDFGQLMLLFSALFLAYGLFVYTANDQNALWQGIGAAVLFRLLFLAHVPELSDDVYRFIWDGRLIMNGLDPFAHPPSYYTEGAGGNLNIPGITPFLYEQLNSPNYFTVYPPVCQSIFAFAAWLFPKDTFGAIVFIRAFILLFEFGSIYLIYKLQKAYQLPHRTVLLYVLNPLVIAELTGNLHFEAGMIFFLLLAFWFLQKQKLTSSALAFGGAVITKLLPMMFLPALIRRIGLKNTFYYGLMVLIVILVGFTPFISTEALKNLFDSINLYFQTFEFNAGVYYVVSWIGELWTGYNLIAYIGPALALTAAALILIYAWQESAPKTSNWPKALVLILTFYFLLSTTIHPWYITPVIAFGALSGYTYPLVWSFLAMLSYSAYGLESIEVPNGYLIIEYGILVPLMLWESRKGGE